MRASFNLLTEPWLPALAMDGASREVGLMEALRQAHRLRDLSDESPLVTVALHRLMLAVLHRVFGPADETAWERLWTAGRFDEAALGAYFASVADRFDLFHPQHPWGQTPDLPERLAAPVARLAPELASGNKATVWDHHCDGTREAVSPAQAARWLLSHQSFCLSGCCGNGERLQGVGAGPLAHAAVFMLRGDTLFETLLLNLIPLAPGSCVPLPQTSADRPGWEPEATPDPEAPPAGYLDYLTWQPRRLRLLPCREGGTLYVCEAIVMPGRQFNVRRLACDPMLGYRGDRRRPGVWTPLRLGVGESPWRHAAQAVRPSTSRWRRPLVLELAARRIARGALPAGAGLRLSTMGLAGEKARVDWWRRDCCVVPAACLQDQDLLADLELALNVAERTHAIVGEHLRTLAAAGASPGAGPDGFWSGLREALDLLPRRLVGSVEERGDALRWWARMCLRQAFRAWTAGTERRARRRPDWRRQAELQDRLAGTLRHELDAVLGVR